MITAVLFSCKLIYFAEVSVGRKLNDVIEKIDAIRHISQNYMHVRAVPQVP